MKNGVFGDCLDTYKFARGVYSLKVLLTKFFVTDIGMK